MPTLENRCKSHDELHQREQLIRHDGVKGTSGSNPLIENNKLKGSDGVGGSWM